jgi:hypothetical protein
MLVPDILDTATLRRLAVEFDVDPRTILKLFRGGRVRGMARHRATRALESIGLRAPLDGDLTTED